MKKIKAFTLLELLIGMIISTLVIGFGYLSYAIVYEQYLSFKSTKQKMTETIQFNVVLTNDFRDAKTITYNEGVLELTQELTPNLRYTFKDNFIVRTQHELNDTFKINTQNILPVYVSEANNEQTKLVSSISFNTNLLGEREFMQFNKLYGADVIINEEIQSAKKQ